MVGNYREIVGSDLVEYRRRSGSDESAELEVGGIVDPLGLVSQIQEYLVVTTRSQSQEAMAGKEEILETRAEVSGMKEDMANLKNLKSDVTEKKEMMQQM